MLRSRTRFAQETRPRAGILRDFAIDHFERNERVQNCIARAISYRPLLPHRAQPENRLLRLYFEVGVSQWSGC